MNINIAVTAAVLAAVLTSLTSVLAPSARGLREVDKVTWSRLSGSICTGCGSEKAFSRPALTDPVAVLAAAPRSTTAEVGATAQQPRARIAGPYRRYASLHRRHAHRYGSRTRRQRDHFASLKHTHRIQIAAVSERPLEGMGEKDTTRPEWSTLDSDRY